MATLLRLLTTIAILLPFLTSCCHAESAEERKSYIVYMGDVFTGTSHLDILHQVVDDSDRASEILLHSYERAFNGFVAKLTEKEAAKVAGMSGVVSVFLDKEKQLHTTRSWDFMGFSQLVPRTTVESDIVVGVIDSGIWPEAESFSDEGFGPPPSKWKGICEAPENFTCNNKIIGARYYRISKRFGDKDIVSPRDSNGHGTHTAATVAGNIVNMASMLGLGMGTARGGVPSARIAVYKACWAAGYCSDSDILSAFHDAISDGVDIISISAGGSPTPYFSNSIAVGAFHAMKNGIFTSQSAGNNGPSRSSVSSTAPWLLSVAASTIDRKFLTKVQLGDYQMYEGISVNTFELKNKMYPLIYGGDGPNTAAGFTGETSRHFANKSLDQKLVNGKIVLCDADGCGEAEILAGAVGIVMQHHGSQDHADLFPLPAASVSVEDGGSIFQYINSTSNSTATIFKSNEEKDTFAPRVASFSSRGPNSITNDILKPDLTAPGVDILAAWSPISPPSEENGDNRVVQYNIISGTSMACPHAAGVAAYIKSFHPTWSPAAIMSALMTTAFPMRPDFYSDTEFAYGAGHINPFKAINPGLVYDAGESDYVKFLCGQGYGLKDNINCSEANNATVWDLNYPSFALSVSGSELISRTFKRNVMNVGSPVSIYKAQVTAPVGLKVQVSPSILSFTSLDQKLPFELTIEGKINTSMVSASLVWNDGVFQVRSPIIVYSI